MKMISTLISELKLQSLLPIILLLFNGYVFAQTNTWTNGGGDNSWSNPNNWSLGVSPSSGQSLLFDGAVSNEDCFMDENFLAPLNSIILNANYSGSLINDNIGTDLTLTNGLTVNGGNFIWDDPTFFISALNILINGGYFNSTGTIRLSNGGTINITNINSFNNSGTLNLNGNATINQGIFNNVIFTSSTSPRLVSILNPVTILGTINFAGNRNLTITGARINFQGTGFSSSSTSTFVGITNDFYVNGSGGQSFNTFSSLRISGNLAFDNSGVTFTNNLTSTNILGNISILGGTFDNYGKLIILAVNKNFVVANGAKFSLTGNSTLPTVSGTGSLIFNPNSTVAYNGSAGQEIGVAAYGSLEAGNNTRRFATNGVISIAGYYNASSSTTTVTGSSVVFNGATDIVSNNAKFNNVTVTGSLNLPDNALDISGNFINLGITTASAGTTYITGNNQIIDNVTFNNLWEYAPTVYRNTIGIGGFYNIESTSRTITGTTFNYYGSGNQNIASLPYNHLQISGSNTKTFTATPTITGNLTITGGTLALSTFDLNLTGNLINTGGTLNTGTSTVSLTGSNTQILLGNNRFYNLNIIKSSGDVTISSGNQSIQNFITLSLAGSNKLNINGNLTLLSTASQTASLIDRSTASNGGSVNGNINVQRFSQGISNIAGHYFSSPVTNAPFSVISVSGFNVLLYSENNVPARLAPTFNGSFRRVTTPGSPTVMTPGRGFSTVQPTDRTLTFTGVPNNGDVSYPITYSTDVPTSVAGWNLIGNPYPSAIDWGSVTKPAGVTAAYVYNSTGYLTIPDAPGNYIPAGQGFFVRATTPTTGTNLTFQNKDRVSNIASTANYAFYRMEEAPKYLKIGLTSKIPTLKSYDEALFSFSADASDDYDNMDSDKLYNPSPLANMYSRVDGKDLAINVLNNSSYTKTVPLYVFVRTSGEYEIAPVNLSSFYSDVDIYLEDTYTESGLMNLSTLNGYTFTHPSSFTGARFKVYFTPAATVPDVVTTVPGSETITGPSLDENLSLLRTFVTDEISLVNEPNTLTSVNLEKAVDFIIYSYKNKIYLKSSSENRSVQHLEIYDVIGNRTYSKSNFHLNENTFELEYLQEGIYIVKVLSEGKIHTKKVVIY